MNVAAFRAELALLPLEGELEHISERSQVGRTGRQKVERGV